MNEVRDSNRIIDPETRRHFIVLDSHKIMYGRVPKVANSSIKEALARLLANNENLDPKAKKNSDRFWRKVAGGQTRIVTKAKAVELNESYFSFSFVRSPFERVVSCYNNKIIINMKISPTLQRMGLYLGMPFEEFVRALVVTPDGSMDVHLLPQTSILKVAGHLVPRFVGRLENINEDWNTLADLMASKGLPTLGGLPSKNVRRGMSEDLPDFFSSQKVVDMIRERYQDDLETFYAGIPVADLVARRSGYGLPPLISG